MKSSETILLLDNDHNLPDGEERTRKKGLKSFQQEQTNPSGTSAMLYKALRVAHDSLYWLALYSLQIICLESGLFESPAYYDR